MASIVARTVVVCTAATVALANRDAPPPNSTGGFNRASCISCHNTHPLNAPGGGLRLTGVPKTYAPGVTYKLTVTLVRPHLKEVGFQIAARDAAGNLAGLLRSIDGHTRVNEGFLQHSLLGTNPSTANDSHWQFEWIAPPTPIGEITFNAAASALTTTVPASFIYTTEAQISPSR